MIQLDRIRRVAAEVVDVLRDVGRERNLSEHSIEMVFVAALANAIVYDGADNQQAPLVLARRLRRIAEMLNA